MSRRKSHVYDMYPQDFNDGVKGFSPATIGIYVMLINLMRVEGGPLPPRRLAKPREEFDEWIRDKLNLKNVKTWLKAKAELLGDPDKLVELPDGRVANPRTERDIAKRGRSDGGSGGQGGEGQGGADQGRLQLVGRAVERAVDRPVDDAVDDAGEVAASPDDLKKFGGSSEELSRIGRSKPLILADVRCAFPYPYIPISLHEVVVAVPFGAARARGDPATARA